MKTTLIALLEALLFLLAFAAGSFLAPLHLRQVLSVTRDGTRIFLWDGVLLASAFFALLLLLEAARKRLARSAPRTTAAFVLALAAGLLLKLGFLTVQP